MPRLGPGPMFFIGTEREQNSKRAATTFGIGLRRPVSSTWGHSPFAWSAIHPCQVAPSGSRSPHCFICQHKENPTRTQPAALSGRAHFIPGR